MRDRDRETDRQTETDRQRETERDTEREKTRKKKKTRDGRSNVRTWAEWWPECQPCRSAGTGNR